VCICTEGEKEEEPDEQREGIEADDEEEHKLLTEEVNQEQDDDEVDEDTDDAADEEVVVVVETVVVAVGVIAAVGFETRGGVGSEAAGMAATRFAKEECDWDGWSFETTGRGFSVYLNLSWEPSFTLHT